MANLIIWCGCRCGGIEVTKAEQKKLEENGCPVCQERQQLHNEMIDAELKARIIVDEVRTLALTDHEKEQKRKMYEEYGSIFLARRARLRELNQIKKLSDKDKPFKAEVIPEPKQDQSESPIARVGEK